MVHLNMGFRCERLTRQINFHCSSSNSIPQGKRRVDRGSTVKTATRAEEFHFEMLGLRCRGLLGSSHSAPILSIPEHGHSSRRSANLSKKVLYLLMLRVSLCLSIFCLSVSLSLCLSVSLSLSLFLFRLHVFLGNVANTSSKLYPLKAVDPTFPDHFLRILLSFLSPPHPEAHYAISCPRTPSFLDLEPPLLGGEKGNFQGQVVGRVREGSGHMERKEFPQKMAHGHPSMLQKTIEDL